MRMILFGVSDCVGWYILALVQQNWRFNTVCFT